MPSFSPKSIVLAVLAGAFLNFLATPAAAVMFPDKNLEAALRALVFEKKDKTDELTDDDLRKIFILDGKGKGITNLAGLEKCENLLEIKLAKNEIVDVAPLKGLTNLQSLDLSNNKISDVTPLTGLVALQYLQLSNNQIASVQPLSPLVKLSALDLSGNKIADLAPLAGLKKLSSLYLAQNQIADIKPLEGLTGLDLLKLTDNQVADLAPLSKLNQIRLLLLERNKVADLAPLVASAKADSEGEKRFAPFLDLYLAGNPLSDAAKNDQLAALKQAGVRVKSL